MTRGEEGADFRLILVQGKSPPQHHISFLLRLFPAYDKMKFSLINNLKSIKYTKKAI